MRVVFGVIFLCAAVSVATMPAGLAEEQQSQSATLISPMAVQDPSNAHPPAQLEAGPVRSELIATSPSGRYGAGSSAFVQMIFSTDVKQSRGLRTQVLIDAQHGEIVGVSGEDVETAQNGSTFLAHIEGLRKGRSKSLLVEMKLQKTLDNQPNKLKITLRSGEAKRKQQETDFVEKSVELNWNVADCAGEYQNTLRDIGSRGGSKLLELWQQVSQADRERSRRWIFEPEVPRRARRRAKNAANQSIANERAIYLTAGRLLRSGADPVFRRKSNLDWAVTKTSADLKKYFTQDDHPAICTGAGEYIKYYEERLSPIRKRGDEIRKLAEEAKNLMRVKTKEILVEAALSKPNGHPAWGGASLAVLKPAEEMTADAKALVVAVAKASQLPAGLLNQVEAAENAYEALRILDKERRAQKELVQIPERFRQSLAAIEASLHLDYALERQKRLEDGFFGSLNAIRDAHAKSCNCNS